VQIVSGEWCSGERRVADRGSHHDAMISHARIEFIRGNCNGAIFCK